MRSNAERNALIDILRQIELAEAFTQDLVENSFSADVMRVYAVTRWSGDYFRDLPALV